MELQIRPAEIEDIDSILAVIGNTQAAWDKRTAKKYYDDYFSTKPNALEGDAVYVGTLGGKVIGVTGYSLDLYETGNYWLNWFYVDKKYQNKGHGKKLLEFVIRELKKKHKHIKKLFADTSSGESYIDALTLYLNNKFKIEAVIRDYYGKGDDQIILSKTIA